jgi:hypothetical protein
MRVLKQEVNKTLKAVNQVWVDAVMKAKKEDGVLDTTEVSVKVIDKIADLDDKFSEFESRNKKNKKGWL